MASTAERCIVGWDGTPTGGLGSLADRSHRPGRPPLQMPPQVEARLFALRWLNPTWGPWTLKSKLPQEFDPCPSRAAIYRALVRNGVTTCRSVSARAADYRRWERTKAMELWQMDVVGRIYLTDGTQLSAVTGIDDHSTRCGRMNMALRRGFGDDVAAVVKTADQPTTDAAARYQALVAP